MLTCVIRKGGGGGGGGGAVHFRSDIRKEGGEGGGQFASGPIRKVGGSNPPPWLRACHMNYMIKFLNNTNHMRCNGLLTVNMKRWTDTSFAARIWECCNVMMKYCTSNIQLVKTVGREKGVEESRGEPPPSSLLVYMAVTGEGGDMLYCI